MTRKELEELLKEYCPVCGCAYESFREDVDCTPEQCWCDQQQDPFWHAIHDDLRRD